MRLACLQTDAILTDALAGRASKADLLRLDAHLETCATCREKQAAFAALRYLPARETPRLSDTARERVRSRLFASLPAGAPASARPLSRAPWLLAAAAASVAAVAVAVVVWAPWRAREADRRPAPMTLQELGPVGTYRLGEALVELEPGTDARWRPAERTVELLSGAVIVDITPGQGHGFRVRTPTFGVEVAGTRFRVDLRGVATERGLVRVVDGAGRLLAEIPAGSRWPALAASSQPLATAAGSQPLPAAVGPSATASVPERDMPPSRPALTAAERLAAARRALSAGRVERARALVQPLLGERREVAVEAHSLMAESYLVAHQYGQAIHWYKAVARRFDGTPQGESALYAVGQLESERGDRGAAVLALERYLARHPGGRYAAEARQRLARLAGPSR